MKRYIFGLMFISISLFGVKYATDYRNYTLAVPIFDKSFYESDTVYYTLPVADTTIDTNYYGEVDTVINEIYPWCSVYDQNSQEGLLDTTATGPTYLVYDRWAMEDWAFSFYIEELNKIEDTDSVSADIQYSHVPDVAWTIPYGLCTDVDASDNLMTYYPVDYFDNWKLYKYARIRLIITSDSVRVRGWLVGRQIEYHELVPPGK